MKVKLVTGYVPIKGHPRTAEEYGRLGDELAKTNVPKQAFYKLVKDCWLYRVLAMLPYTVTHSVGDNPAKNSLDYHIVNHQKTAWLLDASEMDKDSDVFVWVDYGIMHLPGVTPQVIEEFVAKIAGDDIAIPGCWDRRPIHDDTPHWRFCGSLIVCPRKYVAPLNMAVQYTAQRCIRVTKNVPWEVNTWARVEQANALPIKWYAADHNKTMFTNYGATDDGTV